MTRAVARLLLPALLCPSLTAAQSLGDAARKEQERRKKNKQAGVQARVITEEELGGGRPATARPAGQAADPATEAAPAPPPPASAPDEDRERQEQYWRDRANAARAEVARLEEVVKELEKLYLVDGESYVDDGGKTVIRDLAHLREIVARAKSDLAAARQAVADLEDEARRKGALPGWLR
jgi:hypothetical protein